MSYRCMDGTMAGDGAARAMRRAFSGAERLPFGVAPSAPRGNGPWGRMEGMGQFSIPGGGGGILDMAKGYFDQRSAEKAAKEARKTAQAQASAAKAQAQASMAESAAGGMTNRTKILVGGAVVLAGILAFMVLRRKRAGR